MNVSAIHRPPAFARVVPTVLGHIPEITDPLGRHWRQPDLTTLDIGGATVNLTQRQFDALPEYSTTVPSGVYPGKCWKSQVAEIVPHEDGKFRMRWTGVWRLRWFGMDEKWPQACTNNSRVINIINEGETQ